MKGFSKKLLVIMFSLLLYGCAGAGDYSISLPNGYALSRLSAHKVSLARLHSDGITSDLIVPAKVTKLAFNDNYILAKQLGLKLEPNGNFEIPDESKVSYWIIQLDGDIIYGPLTDIAFAQKKKELSIPTDITLKSLNSYNHITD